MGFVGVFVVVVGGGVFVFRCLNNHRHTNKL